MNELRDFYNDGFGWECRHCDRELSSELDSGKPSRLMTEGEAESKSPELSNKALARWADAAQTTLICPRCGITETVDARADYARLYLMLQKELEAAVGLARYASESILDHYSREIVAEQKLGVDEHYEPVTIADRAASRIIVEGLAAEFPDDAILSEEEADDLNVRLKRKRVWIIDPIDGTAGFVKKDGDFGVQIGLAIDGEPALGVVLLPFHNVLYRAVRGEGAFAEYFDRETIELRTSKETDFEKMTLAFSRNHPSKGIKAIIAGFNFQKAIQRGSIGLKIGLIAERQADTYIHLSPRTKLWDTCAPQIILEEAGGVLTDLYGEKYRYDREDLQNHGGIVATNGASHETAVAKLGPILNEIGRSKIRPKTTAG